MNNTNNTLGRNIKKLREKNNMTQDELAEKLGNSGKTISKWENGDTEPKLKSIKELARIFGVVLSDLVSGFVSENLGYDKNMEQIMNFMNDINKKINYLMVKPNVTAEYLRQTKDVESRISFTRDVMEKCDENYQPYHGDEFMTEIVMEEIAERVEAYQFDDALVYCDEFIAKGIGEMASTAMGICDQYLDMLFHGASAEEIDEVWDEQRKYAKIYIHHLMKRFRLSKDDFLE